MSIQYKIVVSAENTNYLAWQTQLFCFSAATRAKQWPLVIVHKTAEPLRREFSRLRQYGCTVVEAPSFRLHPKGIYPPRNELGSLLTVSSMRSLDCPILFCEPDMLFVRAIDYDDALTGEYYRYLDYEERRISMAARRLGLEHLTKRLNESAKVGVPYLIPFRFIHRIATRWLKTLDSFEELDWIDIMYAFGLSLAAERLEIKTSRISNHNYDPLQQLSGSLIHYCYGNTLWNKRSFGEARTPLDPSVCLPDAPSGSVLHEMMRQISEARSFFSDRAIA